MPAFIVSLPAETGHTLPGGANSMVVFATDLANARAIAAGHFEGDSQAAWNAADTVQVVAADDFSDSKWSLRIKILDAVPVINVRADGGINGVVTVVINAAGATYSDNEVLTLSTGTFSRAATFRVTGETGGAIDTLEVIDPGEYTVETAATGVATTGGGDGNATVDVTYADNQYMNLMAEMVGLLNADAQIAGASCSVEDTAGAPNFVISDGTDALGDLDAVVEFMYGESPVPELIGAVTDGGSSGDDLEFVLAVAAGGLISIARPFKS